MSPVDDCFLSASNDKTVQLWNLSTPTPLGKIFLPPTCEQPFAKFDESGMVFGVLCRDNIFRRHTLKLFDARNYEAGPFQDIFPDYKLMESAAIKAARLYLNNNNNNPINNNPEGDIYNLSTPNNNNNNQNQIQSIVKKSLQTSWTSFEFSSDGNHLLLNSASDFLLVLDGFRNDVEPLLITSRKNDAGVALGACFSANSKYVLTGNDDNDFLLLDRNSGELKRSLTGHVAPVGCVCSNPKFDIFATGCVNSVLWIPKVLDDSNNNNSSNNNTTGLT